MEKILRLLTYVDGGINDTPFPNVDNPIEIGAFRYDAKRMGGAPTITASVSYPSCLDDVWTDGVYAEFNSEKYYLKQTPTSSYNNADTMYQHDIELVSERVALDNVYFFDVVSDSIVESDKPVSNSTKVVFFGDIRDFASRLQASLTYSGLDYEVVVDNGVTSEEKMVSFEDQFFSNVLQEIYNTYEVPYYFDGKTIHIGYAKNQELPTFAYGVDDALLSITKNNANYKIVNRATGTGSSDNIPFYYPNNSPKGVIKVVGNSSATFKLVDGNAFANEVGIGDVVTYKSSAVSSSTRIDISNDGNIFNEYRGNAITIVNASSQPVNKWFMYTFNVDKSGSVYVGGSVTVDGTDVRDLTEFLTFAQISKNITRVDNDRNQPVDIKDGYIDCGSLPSGTCVLKLGFSFPYLNKSSYSVSLSLNNSVGSEWYNETQKKTTSLSKMGLVVASGQPKVGDSLTQELVEYINTSQVLLPYKYRETKGAERFYNATNDTYEGVTFNNPFIAGRPKEHIIKVEDIKPSIEGMIVNGERIDMFEDFAYDEDDNDETYEDEEGNVYYKHPYFFAKLKPLGFNLFEHAIEQQPMTISFTSGDCGACNFEIAVDEESQKNTVQVDENGNVMRDENGRVLCGAEGSGQGLVEPQDIQQDTTNRSVWIALQKEDSTYGILMPKAPINGVGGHRPSTNDTFAVLGINLPYEYIENAEKKLEAEIIKYLQNNNDEKFTFSISFSRIYFEENPDVLALLSENSKIQITYNNKNYDLYVSSFSYSMGEGDVLPEIRIELDETLKTSQNALQNAISEVKSTLGNAINQVSYKISTQSRSYVSKVEDDTALGTVDFSKGIKFGEGGKVDILDNNSAKLTIEYLEVTKKASFTSLEIQEKTHVGGQILVTPAAINCGEVEEFDNYYRCYFQTKGEDGEEIFNQFAVGDQAICQTFNAWGSRYYWRLVVGIGNDYIDLSKTDYDDGSGIPQAGDKIIQMGNRNDASRQNAIVIAAYGDGSPYIIQYKGINNYSLPTTSEDERIMTKLSPTENILTGLVRMKAGSSGLEKFTEWQSKQELIDSKASKGDFEDFKAIVEDDLDLIKRQVDGAITTWFYDPVPTLENAPAVEWTTEDDKINHLGDLYYSGEGKAYRFQYDNGTSTYYWNVITDTDIIKALADAKRAQDTADGKRRVFVTQPYPPYDEGDLWSRGSEFPMMVCVNSRESGSYVASDWDFADNNNQLSNEIAGYEYLKEAIQNGDTVVVGGLIQSGVLMLGYNDAYGNYHVMSGTNGIYRPNEVGGGIAAWWGGDMSESLAKAVIRFDGTGFLANGNIRWDEEGGAEFGGGDFKILADGSIIFGEDIKISTEGDETLGSILTELNNRVTKTEFNTWKTDIFNPLSTKVDTNTANINKLLGWFNVDADGNLFTTLNFYSTKEISANGISQGTGGGGSGLISSVLGVGSLGATLTNDNSVVFNAYATNEIYKATQGHASRIGVLESQVGQLTTQGTKVSVSDLLTTGTKIATITVDGVGNTVYAPAIPTKLSQLTDDVVSGKYLPLTGGGAINGYLYLGSPDNTSYYPLTLRRYGTQSVLANSGVGTVVTFNNGTSTGALNITADNASFNSNTLLHSGNYSQYALPLTGGTIDGNLDLGKNSADYTTLRYLRIFYGDGTKVYRGMLQVNQQRVSLSHYTPSNGHYYELALGPSGLVYNDVGVAKTLIHTGNVGDYAIKTDGSNRMTEGLKLASKTSGSSRFSNNSGLLLYRGGITGWEEAGLPYDYCTLFSIDQDYTTLQIAWRRDGDIKKLCARTYSSEIWSDWKTIAFTDSTVEAARRLETPRTIWGQSFDGTGNVNGHLYLPNNKAIYSYDTSGIDRQLMIFTNDLYIGWGVSEASRNTILLGNNIYFRYGTTPTTGLILNSLGNMTIGAQDLAGTDAKLYVDGVIKTRGNIFSQRKDFILGGWDGAETYNILNADANNNTLWIGYGSAPKSHTTYICGNEVYLRYGTSRTNGFILNSSGNVTVGGVDNATTKCKFFVDGSTVVNSIKNSTQHPTLGNAGGGGHLVVGNLNLGLEMWTRSDGHSALQAHRLNGTAEAFNLILQPLGGNIGIGTTNPKAKVDVAGNIRTEGFYINRKSDNVEAFEISNVDNTNGFDIRTLGGYSFLSFSTATTTPSEKMRILGNGNVLIGTTDDSGYKLDVNGKTHLNAYVGDNAYVNIGSYTFGLRIESRGNGNTFFQSQRFDGTTAYYSIVLQELGGNVGIGLSAPLYKLDVAGTLHATGAVTFDSTLTIAGATTHNGIAYFGGTTYYINTSGNTNFNAISGSSLQVDSAVFNGTIHSNEYSGNVAKWSITKDGAASFASLSNGGLLETSTLRVSSTSTFTGKTNHNGGIGATSLNVSGTSTLSGHVGIGISPHSTYALYVDGSLRCGPIDGGTASLGALYSNTHVPNSNNTYDLGSTSYRWASIYGVGADFSGNVTVNGTLYTNDIDGSDIYITASGDLYLHTLTGYVGANNERWAIDGYGNYKGQSLYINPRDNDNEIITDNNKKKTHGFPREGVAVFVNGDIAATGEISANAISLSSDIRFKHQLGDITLDLDTIANAPMFRFTWTNKENSRVQIGTSAQYWKDSARELVSVDKDDFHRLDYATLGVLIGVTLGKTVKNHEDRIKELEREVVELKEENRRLRYEC